MYQHPKKMLTIQILLIIIGFVGFILGAAISGLGGSAAVIAVVINGLILLIMVITCFITIGLLIKRLLDKQNNQHLGIYLINVIISIVVTGFFVLFYVTIALAISTIVLPFV